MGICTYEKIKNFSKLLSEKAVKLMYYFCVMSKAHKTNDLGLAL